MPSHLRRIGVGAAHQHADPRARGRRERAAEQRRERGRAARFGDQAQPVPDQPLRGERWRRPAPARQRPHDAWAIGNISSPT